MATRTFYHFVSARGEDVIEAWLADIPWQARDAINLRLKVLQNMKLLERPWADYLTEGECKGLIEIRVKVERVQYRPLAFAGPEQGQLTLLVGAREKGKKFEPRNACDTAHQRIAAIQAGRATINEHKFRD